MIAVRKLMPDEWLAYRTLRLQSLTTDPHAFAATHSGNLARPDQYWRSRLEDSLADPRRSLFFVLSDDQPVGMAGAYPGESEFDPVEIISVYVEPRWRGQGLAGMLLAALIDVLHRSGVRLLALDVNEAQRAAVSLYESFGFRIASVAEAEHPDGSKHTLLRMCLELPSHVDPSLLP